MRWTVAPIAVTLLVPMVSASMCAAEEVSGGRGPELGAAVTVLYPAAPSTLDPHLTTSVLNGWYLDNVCERLFQNAADGSLVPHLVAAWNDEAEGAWVLRLRDGIRFHDGKAMTSADVVASLVRATTHPGSRLSSVAAIPAFEALDPLRIRIRARLSPSQWQLLLSRIPIVPEGSPPEIVRPVGTGPYRMEVVEAGKLYSLTAFPEYWGTKPRIANVRIVVEPDGVERSRRLLAGAADVVAGLPGSEIAAVEAKRGFWVATNVGTSIAFVTFNTRNEPFDDPLLRAAIDLAIDRERLAEKLEHLVRPTGQLLTPAMPGFDPSLEPGRPDPARSRALLAEAGRSSGLDLEIVHSPATGAIAEEIAVQLAAVGVRSRLRNLAVDLLLPTAESAHDSLFLMYQLGSAGDPVPLLQSLLHTPDPEGGRGGSNFSRHGTPEMDALLARAAAAEDPAERALEVAAVSRLLREERTYLPLVWGVELIGLRSELDWTPRVDGRILFAELLPAE